MLAGLGYSYRKLGVGLGHRSSTLSFIMIQCSFDHRLTENKILPYKLLITKAGSMTSSLDRLSFTFKAIYNRPGMYDLQYLRLKAGQCGWYPH